MSKLTEREKANLFIDKAILREKKPGEINVFVHHRIHENDAEAYIDGMIKLAEQIKIQSN